MGYNRVSRDNSTYLIFTLTASSGKCNVLVWHSSIHQSVCSVHILTVTHQGAVCDAASIYFGPTVWTTNLLASLENCTYLIHVMLYNCNVNYLLRSSRVKSKWWIHNNVLPPCHAYSIWIFTAKTLVLFLYGHLWPALLGRLCRRVDLIKPVSNVRPCVHMYVCTYVRPQNVSSISMKFGVYMEVDEWCTMVCSMTRSKVKVTSHSELEIRPVLKAIFSAIYDWSWQLTTDT